MTIFYEWDSFQALPYLGLSFRYGASRGGSFAQGRINWDRSFDVHISVLDEGAYVPYFPWASRFYWNWVVLFGVFSRHEVSGQS